MNWETSVKSETSPDKEYILKFRDGIFSCSCMAWRKRQCSPITKRTCKHLVKYLGKNHEMKRAPESFHGITVCRSVPRYGRSEHNIQVNPMLFHTISDEKMKKTASTLIGWFVSVKLDGAFGRWDGEYLYSKTGRNLNAPKFITDCLPEDVLLDGEIYSENKNDVRKALNGEWTNNVKFMVFDIADAHLPFQTRFDKLKKFQLANKFNLISQHQITEEKDLAKLIKIVEKNNEEGLVLRDPQSKYSKNKRSRTTVKWKPTSYGEGKITKIISKKRGVNLEINETQPFGQKAISPKNTTFTLYVPNFDREINKVGQTIKFKFNGRHENGKPENPKIYH